MNRRKSILLAALVVLLLTFSVSGTIAWLTTSTKPIENTFTPATVDTEIVETFTNNVKSSITVKNNGTASAYVRVALVANWVNANGEIVAPASVDLTGKLNSNWTKSGEYYYYTKEVPVGEATSNLLAENQTITQPSDGPADASLQIVVLHQSIQAQGGAVAGPTNWTITDPTAN